MKIETKHTVCPHCGKGIDYIGMVGTGKHNVKAVSEDGEITMKGAPKIEVADMKPRLGPKGRLMVFCEEGHHWWAMPVKA